VSVRRPYRPGASLTSRRRVAPAFSLAELMIAVMLLGLGLLFIAAALPVGIDYTRRNLDAGDARSAADEALALLRARVRTSENLVAPGVPRATYHRADHIFRPRRADGSADDLYEPVIKVRPLVLGNVLAERDGNREPGTPVIDPTEAVVTLWYQALGRVTSAEADVAAPRLGLNPARFAVSGPLHALLRDVPFAPIRPTERVFPLVRPAATDATDPLDVLRELQPATPVPYRPPDASEWRQVLERRIAWTAFYRRVSYRRTIPPAGGRGGELLDDPLRYEFIVVVARRPTPQHRYAVQDASRGIDSFRTPRAVTPGTFAAGAPYGALCVAPVPWLVVFREFEPLLRRGRDYDYYLRGPGALQTGERYLRQSLRDSPPARLTFRCSPEVGRLLAPGSILIPARNDWRPSGLPNALPQLGFVPGAPDTMPIYRVVQRPDLTTVVVENNGYYPWNFQDRWARQMADQMPFWVIPPPFVSRDANGQPIFEQTSPILTVVRQVIRLPQLPQQIFGITSGAGGPGGGGGRVP